MANSFSASSLCPDLARAVASAWWTSGFPGVRRSALRKAGAFENSQRNFAEFKWANFFRGMRLLDRIGLAGMSRALFSEMQSK